MSLTNSYLTSTKNFDAIMNSILSARAPERFTNKFLEDLGFKSSKQRFTRGYKRYKETSGLMEWKIGHIFHSIFT